MRCTKIGDGETSSVVRGVDDQQIRGSTTVEVKSRSRDQSGLARNFPPPLAIVAHPAQNFVVYQVCSMGQSTLLGDAN
jgi:hypothetical protein